MPEGDTPVFKVIGNPNLVYQERPATTRGRTLLNSPDMWGLEENDNIKCMQLIKIVNAM